MEKTFILQICNFLLVCLCHLVAPVMERVSGNVVEFEMSSLTPATHYTVKVYAVRDSARSAATTTEFTTGAFLFYTVNGKSGRGKLNQK